MQVARALLHAGAAVDPEDGVGVTPLHLAAIRNHRQARLMR